MCENAGRQASTVNRFMRPEARLPAEEMTTLISQAHINVHGVTDLAGHWLGTGMYLGGAMFNHRYVVCICLFGRTFVNQRASSPHPWIDNRRPPPDKSSDAVCCELRHLTSGPLPSFPDRVGIGGHATGVLRSCAPSCAVSFHRGTLHVHATRDVTAGEELSIAYVELYAAGVDRRAQLQTKKFFQWYTHPPSSSFCRHRPRRRVGRMDLSS